MGIYNSFDYAYFLENMLNRFSNDVDKREGTLPFDFSSAAALEFNNLYIQLDFILAQTYAKTSSGDWLMLRTAERNVYRKEPTFALVKGEFNIPIPLGSRFSCEDVNYFVESSIFEDLEDEETLFYYSLRCEQAGIIGNKNYGNLKTIENIYKLSHAQIVSIIIPGEDKESDDSLKDRYYKTFNNLSFGGNKDDYIRFVGDIEGVGTVKPFRRTKGNETVEVVFMSSDNDIPSAELVEYVQNKVDPNKTGEGDGIAPIWHFVNVQGVKPKEINVNIKLVLADDMELESVTGRIKDSINNYLLGLRGTWEQTENITVRVSRIEATVLNIDGVIDIVSTEINGASKNITLNFNEVPTLGDVTHE